MKISSKSKSQGWESTEMYFNMKIFFYQYQNASILNYYFLNNYEPKDGYSIEALYSHKNIENVFNHLKLQ